MISRILVGIAAAAMMSCSAMAGTVMVVGEGTPSVDNDFDPGKFKATISYGYSAGDAVYQLTVSLENLTASGNGNLTGFIFGGVALSDITVDLDSVSGTGVLTDGDWEESFGTSSGSFGSFQWGASLPPDFQGGGSGASGIDTSETGVFVFNVTGSGAGLLDVTDFLQANAKGNLFLARFKGLGDNEDGSDKVLGTLVIVPLPAPVWMAGAGLLAVVGYRMKRRTV